MDSTTCPSNQKNEAVSEVNIPPVIEHQLIELIKTFSVYFPEDFSLDRTRERCGKVTGDDGESSWSVRSWHRAITERKFRTSLTLGKTYLVELYCLKFDTGFGPLISLAKQFGRITGGAWGGALLHQYYRKELVQPRVETADHDGEGVHYREVICLDTEENLWTSWLNGLLVPFLHSKNTCRYLHADHELFHSLVQWETGAHNGSHLVLFRKTEG